MSYKRGLLDDCMFVTCGLFSVHKVGIESLAACRHMFVQGEGVGSWMHDKLYAVREYGK